MTRNQPLLTNPWHDVSFGTGAPSLVDAIIEIPKGSRAKYELDKDSGMLRMDRVLFSAMFYPANYGFIPQTYCEDGDPLDILVLSQIDVVPFCIVEAKVIGVMQMLDAGEADDKIIAVCNTDVSVNHIDDIADLPPHFMKELRNFFEDYKKLEKKAVQVADFQGREKAEAIVRQAIADYREKF